MTEIMEGAQSEWIRGIPLGRGSFSTVNLAIPKSTRRPLMVVKSSEVSTSDSLWNEREILRRIGDRCPQIIRCFGDEITNENGCRLNNLLFEYASGGSLYDHIRRCPGKKLSEFEVRRHTNSILRGLCFIHEAGFVHCDIKLQNILLFDGGKVKIADFGLAREKKSEIVRESKRRRMELRGTPLYMSPEIVAGNDGDEAADVWALGCAVVEMASGTPAWKCDPGCGVPELLCRIGAGEQSPEIPEKLSEEGKDFVSKCFVKDPNQRWTAQMLLDHPFVSGLGVVEKLPAASKTTPSPRGPFDFSDSTPMPIYISDAGYSDEEEEEPYYSDEEEEEPCCLGPILERVEKLASNPNQEPDWSDSEGWFTVR